MIIYVQDISIDDFNKLCSLKATLLNTEHEIMFYSDYGIFILRNNIFYKQVIESKHNELIKKPNINLLIDNSFISYKQVFSQIPADSVVKSVKLKKYQLGEVVFVVVSHDEILFDFYIDTRMNISNPLLEKTISSFLFE